MAPDALDSHLRLQCVLQCRLTIENARSKMLGLPEGVL
jgi:hypothetical protein